MDHPGRGDPVPGLPDGTAGLSEMVEANPADWLDRAPGFELGTQVLRQRDDRFIVLLHAEMTGDADDDTGGIEDAAARFSRFNR